MAAEDTGTLCCLKSVALLYGEGGREGGGGGGGGGGGREGVII